MTIGPNETLQRILFREFLLEPDLPRDAGLDDLPARLAAVLGCSPDEALERLTRSPVLEALPLEDMQHLLAIRDMGLLSHTPAAIAVQLRDPAVSYDQCIRTALCYGVAGRNGQAFSALRAAAARNDQYARHHFLYGLLLGLQGHTDRACWELAMALHYEPYDEGRARIRRALDALEEC